jgi:hypothetical protein
MLHVNCFKDGGALLEAEPQGDAWIPVNLLAADEAVLAGLISSLEVSGALARLFLAGVTAGERAVRQATRPPAPNPLP